MTPCRPATDTPDLGSLREEQALLRGRLAQAAPARSGSRWLLEFALDAVGRPGHRRGGPGRARRWLPARPAGPAGPPGRAAWSGSSAALLVRSLPRFRAARLDDLSLAMTLDRYRPGTGQQVADVLQLPEQLDETGLDGLAGAGPAGRPARQRGARGRPTGGRTGTGTDGDARPGPARRAARPGRRSRCWPRRGPAERGAVAPGLERAMAAEDVPDRDRPRRRATGSWRPATSRSPSRSGPTCRTSRPEATGWTSRAGASRSRSGTKPETPAIPETVRLRERTAEGAVRDAVMTAIGPGRFRHELPPSSASSTFELIGGDDWLGPIRVERVDRPSLEAIRLRVREPGVAEGANSATIEDTRQHLDLPARHRGRADPGRHRADRPDPGRRPPGQAARPRSRVDPKTFAARWTLREATTLEIQLTSERDRAWPRSRRSCRSACSRTASRASRSGPRASAPTSRRSPRSR